ncbi:30S ribosomal protein S3 [bacterium]|nr:30S ribosomal protein S3 [bacterium]
MGQKVNPIIFRMGISQNWRSRWFSDKNYIAYLQQDITIRRFLKKRLKDASIDRIEIKRSGKEIELVIRSSRPGIIIGRGGSGIEDLKKEIIKKYIKNQKQNLKITIEEVKRPMLSAGILLQSIIEQVEKRIPYRRVMKKTIEKAMQAGCDGIKIIMSGRLNGVEIARTETLKDGRLPLHTLRANIDYSRGVARTTYGAVGVKVWVYLKDDKSQKEDNNNDKRGYSRPNNFARRNNFNK